MPRSVDPAAQDARRQAVAEAVWSVLEQGGVEALTVRAVARQAGFSTGALSHYFATKDDLLTYAMALAFDRVAERMLAASQQEPALSALRAICLENMPIDRTRRTEYHAWLFFWSRAATTPNLAQDHAQRYELWRATVEYLIKRGQTDGSIRTDCVPHQEAELLTAFIDGIGLQSILEPDRLNSSHAPEVLDAYLRRLSTETA
jgi:AcrR family transcriptional regulator